MSKVSLYAVALTSIYTGTKPPYPDPEKQPHCPSSTVVISILQASARARFIYQSAR